MSPMEARLEGTATLQREDRRIMRAVLPMLPEPGSIIRCAGTLFYVMATSTQSVLCREAVLAKDDGEAIVRLEAPDPALARWLSVAKEMDRWKWHPERIAMVLEVAP